ncbi:aldolase/citrate lyase family protein [Amycolatopsis rhabdoformis]|uniref:Aldolase/citrate lyase family protein n=1 Tax=Amycolatopsis rhabdoformis TaxID=1448059 RepID=A0ABZ1IGR7_9PSEU|nr:aldolase/citrate lyase family protein [Amycolatopsis rhabdoformis]WSE33614.1 aldolase/citrate lyase family protein [Amycolatopsis rhabdoformis]
MTTELALRLKEKLAGDGPLLGTFAGLGSPVAVEIAAAAGADWVLLDLEHGGGSEELVGPAVTAAAAYGVPLLVRTESGDRPRAGRALDGGASGIMIPRIADLADARAAVRILRYPPDGDRGVATYNRQARFGLRPSVLTTRNDEVVGVVQIETLGAVRDIDAIAATEGVDVLFVGPVDLSYALGVPLAFDSPEFGQALSTVADAAKRHGKTAGIMASSAAVAARHLARGFRFVSVASDASLLARTLYDAFASIRDDLA